MGCPGVRRCIVKRLTSAVVEAVAALVWFQLWAILRTAYTG
jgi:hypothetical protein